MPKGNKKKKNILDNHERYGAEGGRRRWSGRGGVVWYPVVCRGWCVSVSSRVAPGGGVWAEGGSRTLGSAGAKHSQS